MKQHSADISDEVKRFDPPINCDYTKMNELNDGKFHRTFRSHSYVAIGFSIGCMYRYHGQQLSITFG